MGDPIGGFVEGFQAGYSLKEAIRARRRRERQEDEDRAAKRGDRRRALERGAIEDAALREETGLAITPSTAPRLDTEFEQYGPEQPQAAPSPVVNLRTNVARRLGAAPPEPPMGGGFPDAAIPDIRGAERGIRFGGVEQVGTPRAVTEELGYDPDVSTGSLEGDIRRSGQPPLSIKVGQTLGRLAGRKLSDEEAGLVGRGAIPASALRIPRAPTSRLPITLDQALKVVDRVHGRWDPDRGYVHDKLTPAQRYAIAEKMVAGTLTPADLPSDQDPAPAGAAAPGARTPGLFQRGWEALFGGPARAEAQRAGGPPGGPAAAVDPQRVREGQQILMEYQDLDLPDDEMQRILSEAGYSDEEIAAILGG